MSDPEDIARDAAHDDYIDGLIDEYAPEYIDEHSEEIIEKYQKAGLRDAIIYSHPCAIIEANLSYERALQQMDERSIPEALFNGYRALEGYCTDVFISSLHSSFVSPFGSLLGELNIRPTEVFGRSLNQKATFIYLGLYAVATKEVATQIRKRFDQYLKRQWPVRNMVCHSFWTAEPEEAKAHLSRARDMLLAVAAPLIGIHQELADEAHSVGMHSRAYKGP